MAIIIGLITGKIIGNNNRIIIERHFPVTVLGPGVERLPVYGCIIHVPFHPPTFPLTIVLNQFHHEVLEVRPAILRLSSVHLFQASEEVAHGFTVKKDTTKTRAAKCCVVKSGDILVTTALFLLLGK